MRIRCPLRAFAILLVAASGCRGEVYDDAPSRPNRAARCGEGDALPAAAPLRRLTALEYQNTVRDLFAPLTIPQLTFPEATTHGRFATNAAEQVVSPLWVGRSQENGEAIAALAISDRAWMRCGDRDAVTCAREVLPELFTSPETKAMYWQVTTDLNSQLVVAALRADVTRVVTFYVHDAPGPLCPYSGGRYFHTSTTTTSVYRASTS